MFAGCVTTSDLTPLPSLLSRYQSGTVDNPRYSDRPCHILMLPAVVVRVGMLRRRILDCGSRRGWKGTGSGSDPTPASTLAGTLCSHIQCRSKATDPPTDHLAVSLHSLQDKKSLGSLHGKQLQLVACRRVDAAASSVDLFLFVLGSV